MSKKPSFLEHVVEEDFSKEGTMMDNLDRRKRRIILDDIGLIFRDSIPLELPYINPAGDGIASLKGYKRDTRMSTMPEFLNLIYAAIKNQDDSENARDIIDILRSGREFLVDTGVLFTPEEMYVQDNPMITSEVNMYGGYTKVIKMDEEGRQPLTMQEENQVSFSRDGKTRATYYKLKSGKLDLLELSKNPGIAALVGGKENAEKMSEFLGLYGKTLFLWHMGNVAKGYQEKGLLALKSDREGIFFNIRLSRSMDYYSNNSYSNFLVVRDKSLHTPYMV
jgi:hypothetical protein